MAKIVLLRRQVNTEGPHRAEIVYMFSDQAINEQLFETFPNLEVLDLSSNRRSIVMQPSFFMKATQLTRLNLHNTEFGCLTE